MEKRYKIDNLSDLPIIKELREKYENMLFFDDIDSICERFGVKESRIRRLIYSKRLSDQKILDFDTIIRMSHMFDIPYEEFVNYNAALELNRTKSKEDREKEDELLKQYSVGKKWEDQVIKYYSDRNYFVYKIPTMNNGTVFDIIAIHGGAALMIECKHTDSDKLYYAGCGILKKRDEIDHFISTTKNNLYIYVNSERTGTWWTTWALAKPIFEEKGYITKEDCFPCDMNPGVRQ